MNLDHLKQSNEKKLLDLGIDINVYLPTIDFLHEVNPPTAEVVASRLCALRYVTGMGFDADPKELWSYLVRYNLTKFVTEGEKAALMSQVLSKPQKAQYSWYCEAAQALAWAIGIADLDHFKACDDDLAERLPIKTDPSDFILSAQLVPMGQIQVQTDLLYRMHWYCKKQRREGMPSKLDYDVVEERRKAMDWVYGCDEDWDEIDLST